MAKKGGFFDFEVETDEVLANSTAAPAGDVMDDDIENKEYDIKDEIEDLTDTAGKPAEVIVSEGKVEPKIEVPAEVATKTGDLVSMLEDIAEDLEVNDLLFVGDTQYEQSVKGLKDMLKDNFVALKEKLEKESNAILASRLADIEKVSQPKFADMSVDDEDSAKLMLTKWYEATGLDEEEIDEKITEWQELGLLSKEAKSAQKFLIRLEKEVEAQQEQERVQAEQEEVKQNEQYVANLKKAILDTEDVLGIKPTAKQKKEFTDYLFKFDKDGKTQAIRDGEDESKRLKLAWMQFLDYKASDLKIEATTKAANELEKRSKRFTTPESVAKGTTRREMEETTEFKKGSLDWWAPGRQDD